MKKTILACLSLILSVGLFGQDVIYMKDFTDIEAVIIDISEDEIVYQPYGYPAEYTRKIPISSVVMIIYQNGTVKSFEEQQGDERINNQTYQPSEDPILQLFDDPGRPVQQNPPPRQEEPVRVYEVHPTSSQENSSSKRANDRYFTNKQNNYFSMALGYGTSYGGLGLRLQGRVGGVVGIGFHGGVGFFPAKASGFDKNYVFYNGGLKFFFYKGLYLDGQFGIWGVENYTEIIEEYENGYLVDFYYYYEEKPVYGPSVLVGGDWIWGGKVGFGLNAAAGISINVQNETNFERVRAALDLGFIIKF